MTQPTPLDGINARIDRLTDTVAELVTLLGDVAVPDPPKPSAYSFHPSAELLWAIGTATGTVLIQALTDVDKITDYRVWIVGVVAALIRAGIGAALSQSKPKTAGGN